MTRPAPAPPVFRIRPETGWTVVDLAELWEYRELAFFLVWRDIKVRYKQTSVGILWALIQPATMMLVSWIFFGRYGKIPSDGVPYPLFALAGLVPWQLFARAISDSTSSLVTDQRLITRVYFPRVLVPTATVLAALVDLGISLVLLLALMLVLGHPPTAAILLLPLVVLQLAATAIGVGLWLSALNVEYRDVTYVIPFLSQLWFFLTPVVYPSSMLPPWAKLLLALNPMTGVIEAFRYAFLGTPAPTAATAVSAAMSIAVLVTGLVWFRVRERSFVDTIGSGGY